MSDPNLQRMRTPTPRDYSVDSASELMPFRSSRIKLWKSPLFLLALLAALVTPFLFAMMNGALDGATVQARMASMTMFGIVGVFFLLMLTQLVLYLYVKPGRSIWAYLLIFAIVATMLYTGVVAPYFYVFRNILPGQIDPAQHYLFLVRFYKMFFAAGLCEELIKATPVLIGAGLTFWAAKSPNLVNNVVYKLLHVRGPLDGVLMGMFAGGGFIFMETAFDYIPRLSTQVLRQTNDPYAAVAMGMLLLLPRVFNGLVGHMAYSGLFGYFIGLSVIRRSQVWKLLGIGWVSAATIHALWNSVDEISPLMEYLVAGICAVAVVGALLKARQLEADRVGAPVETSGSIVVERPQAAATPQAYAPPQPTYAPPAAAPAPMPTANAASPQALALDIDGFILPLRAGGRIEPALEPALAGRGGGVVGEIVEHPSRPGVLGLRNAGSGLWTARMRDGGVQTIEANQNVRLAPGVVIAMSHDLIGTVRALG